MSAFEVMAAVAAVLALAFALLFSIALLCAIFGGIGNANLDRTLGKRNRP